MVAIVDDGVGGAVGLRRERGVGRCGAHRKKGPSGVNEDFRIDREGQPVIFQVRFWYQRIQGRWTEGIRDSDEG